MISITAKDMDYSIHQIADMSTWQGVIAWSGERCGDRCGATANVLIGPGWFCPCGHYNCMSWNHHIMPHTNPTYGPTSNKLRLGYKVADLKKNAMAWFRMEFFVLI